MKNSLYERIHDLRERSGMTQTDLALRMGVTRSGVNAWEMGISKPTLDNLVNMTLKLIKIKWSVVKCRGQSETIIHKGSLP